jgi:hypothetical protein
VTPTSFASSGRAIVSANRACRRSRARRARLWSKSARVVGGRLLSPRMSWRAATNLVSISRGVLVLSCTATSSDDKALNKRGAPDQQFVEEYPAARNSQLSGSVVHRVSGCQTTWRLCPEAAPRSAARHDSRWRASKMRSASPCWDLDGRRSDHWLSGRARWLVAQPASKKSAVNVARNRVLGV